MSNPIPQLSAGYRLLKVGEIVLPDDQYWYENTGPWTEFQEGEDVGDSIGEPVSEQMHPCRRYDP